MTTRSDLVSSAVKFLTDPKVRDAPLAKRISFLETKGLSQDEIQAALKMAEGGPAVPLPSYPQHMDLSLRDPSREWGWKDYTLLLVGLAGSGYGLFQLFDVRVKLATFVFRYRLEGTAH